MMGLEPTTRVDDGARTHDTRNHNPMLYQLNYIHHVWDCKCKEKFRHSKIICAACKKKSANRRQCRRVCANIQGAGRKLMG